MNINVNHRDVDASTPRFLQHVHVLSMLVIGRILYITWKSVPCFLGESA